MFAILRFGKSSIAVLQMNVMVIIYSFAERLNNNKTLLATKSLQGTVAGNPKKSF